MCVRACARMYVCVGMYVCLCGCASVCMYLYVHKAPACTCESKWLTCTYAEKHIRVIKMNASRVHDYYKISTLLHEFVKKYMYNNHSLI